MSALGRLERLEKLQQHASDGTITRKNRFAPRSRHGKERFTNRDSLDTKEKNTRQRASETIPSNELERVSSEKDASVIQTNSCQRSERKECKEAKKNKEEELLPLPAVSRKRKRSKNKEDESVRSVPSKLTLREIIQRSNSMEKRKTQSDRSKVSTNQTNPKMDRQDKSKKEEVLAPQVAVVDGKIVVDEVSLRVEAAPIRSTPLRRVEEMGTRLNAATYANRIAPEKWTNEDTALFYRALKQFGTDFSLIERLFPGRTRKQIKRKFKTEEALKPDKVEAALHPKDRNDAEHYRAMIDMLQAAKEAKKRELEGEEDEPSLMRKKG